MAYTDLSSFLPSESAYKNPGEFEITQRNLAIQRGTFQSEMDRFYAQLNETARQFDLSIELQQDQLGLKAQEIGLTREQLQMAREEFDFTSELAAGEFLEKIRQFDVSAKLKEAELEVDWFKAHTESGLAESQKDYNKTGSLLDWVSAADTILDWL